MHKLHTPCDCGEKSMWAGPTLKKEKIFLVFLNYLFDNIPRISYNKSVVIIT